MQKANLANSNNTGNKTIPGKRRIAPGWLPRQATPSVILDRGRPDRRRPMTPTKCPLLHVYLTPIREASERMKVATAYVSREVRNRNFPGKKINGRWFLPKHFVDEFARQRHNTRAYFAFVELAETRIYWRFDTRRQRKIWLKKAVKWAQNGWVAGIADAQKLTWKETNEAMEWKPNGPSLD